MADMAVINQLDNPGTHRMELLHKWHRQLILRLAICLSTFPLIGVNVVAADKLTVSAGQAQLGAPFEYVAPPTLGGAKLLLQRSRDQRLILTPNECFFPSLGLTATGKGTGPSDALNQGGSFLAISEWDEGDVAEWGLFFQSSCLLDVHVYATGAVRGDQLTLSVGEEQIRQTIAVGTAEERSVLSGRISVSGDRLQRLQLRCDRLSGNRDQPLMIRRIEIRGGANCASAVVRKRWRPAAAHTRFTSSQKLSKIRLWVMEMDAVPGTLGFYAPVTTPFGYYGPTWQADGRVNTSFNFSLWSFKRGAPEPPIEQLSHLVAIGNPKAQFSGFGHEGTGVKIRGWNPLEGRQGQRQAFALRVEPGPVYDTYFSYFFAPDEKRWRLFGGGKKFNKRRPLESLWVGSFVEVPGPAARQRTGVYPRRMRYRGWVMDENGKLAALDRMSRGNVDRQTGLTHTDRGLTDDGWFYLETGSWYFRTPGKGPFVEADSVTSAEDVEYLRPADLKMLQAVPSAVEPVSTKATAAGLRLRFRIRNASRGARVTAFWGAKEGLTFSERWAHSKKLTVVKDGLNEVNLPVSTDTSPVLIRLLLTNDQGQFWSMDTFRGDK